MKKLHLLILCCFLFASPLLSQTFILNEDFSGTSGTNPPDGWNNQVISGNPEDLWHFDNPGQRILNYPITDPFAIFDSENISANGQPEMVALETPVIDASISNYILLSFDHTLNPGSEGNGIIEAYDGNNWIEIKVFTGITSNPKSEVVDLSAVIGGITNAQIRFLWSGNGSGFWAVDNIRIYAALSLDAGVVNLDGPISPVVPGIHDIIITLGNFGYNTITSTTVEWTANGTIQTPYNWNGSISVGQTESGINIGSYNFQDPVLLKIWQTDPNGQTDLNPFNDTITRIVQAALCGTYTIGGSDPDFDSFSGAAQVLNTAGISCPVTFIVRDGIYVDQLILSDIQGISPTNTITFISESNDPSLAVLQIIPEAAKFEPLVLLSSTRHIIFEDIGLQTGATIGISNPAFQISNSKHIVIRNCIMEAKKQFDLGILIENGCEDISISQNNFECINARAGAISIDGQEISDINITENSISGTLSYGYSSIKVANGSHDISIANNQIEQCFRGIHLLNSHDIQIENNLCQEVNIGISIDNQCNNINVSANRFLNIMSHPNDSEGTGGIFINSSSLVEITNNFIQTQGDGPCHGIKVNNGDGCKIHFNSVNVKNNDTQGKSRGITIENGSSIVANNNIFRIAASGVPISVVSPVTLPDLDYNNYYSFKQVIGYYNGNFYSDLSSWSNALGTDNNSLSANPFFTSGTDLSINQILLNNAGLGIPGIETDIDGTPRDPEHPDIGAKEYNPCEVDAGINDLVSPQSPLSGGTEDVRVILQNQGTENLTSVTINWQVNEVVQNSFTWAGNLAQIANTEINIGQFDFQAGELYTIKAWTTNPNNTSDCNNANDTAYSQQLAVPLCGTFTIGGSNPDFNSITEAANILNLAGISCDVTFMIREGSYEEQFLLGNIQGTSADSRITFRSENGNSFNTILKINSGAARYDALALLKGTEYITFKELGFVTGSATSNETYAILTEGAKNIDIEGCSFSMEKSLDFGIVIREGSQDITIINNDFQSINARAGSIIIEDPNTKNVEISQNKIDGASEYGFSTILIRDQASLVNVIDNEIKNSFRSLSIINSGGIIVQNNIILDCNNGIFIDNQTSEVLISANRLINIKNHQNSPEGTHGIYSNYSGEIDIFNNFILTSGDGAVTAIFLENTFSCQVRFNSINITSNDVQGLSKGLMVSQSQQINSFNNIFKVKHKGTPVFLEGNLTEFDFNNNNYYSFSRAIGSYNGIRYMSLEEWTEVVNMDINSFSVNPFYTSDVDLSMNQALLEGAAIPQTGINFDIEGDARDPLYPDIGAKEYELCSIDAGINEVISPDNPLVGGQQDVIVILQNQGSGSLTSSQINWAVNGVSQSEFGWSGNLGKNQNTEITIGQYDFQQGTIYNIRVWSSEPNNATDCNNLNDTAYSRELSSPLCGTYTIGGSNPDFFTISDAFEVLNTAGITCPVTFLVRNGTYTGKYILRAVSGSSEENTITFRSESGDSTKAVIELIPSALKYDPLIQTDGSQHLTFKQLGFYTGSDEGDANNVFFLSDVSDITIEGCYINLLNRFDFGIVAENGCQNLSVKGNNFNCIDSRSGAIEVSGNGAREIIIQGNRIIGAEDWGNSLIRIEQNVKIVNISGNFIERASRPVYISRTDTINFTDNIIQNANEGIYIEGWCSAIDIFRNRFVNITGPAGIPDGTIGIYINNSKDVELVNNFIHGTGLGPVAGINIQNTDTCLSYFNTINITNNDPQKKSRGLILKGIDEFTGKNNIFHIKQQGIPFYIDDEVTKITLDYNNYYHPDGIVGVVDGQEYNSLFEWGEYLNSDANSLTVNTYFKTDTTPLPFQKALNGAGIPIEGIIFDIDGKVRWAQAPDIGCLEFLVDYGITELLSPTLNCFHASEDSVTVFIKHFGDVPFNDLKVAFFMDDGPVYIDTIPGPLYGDIIHTFKPTVDITHPGEYFFKIWLIGTLDDNINNDTLNTMRYSKPPPDVSFTYDNFCTGPKVFFFGQASIGAPHFIESYEWLFGDGETSLEQNPEHTYASPGTYEVKFRAYSDAGCYSESIENIFIDPEFEPLNMILNVTPETCLGDGTGVLEIITTGEYPPFRHYINGEEIFETTITNFSMGQYEVRVIDSENCEITQTIDMYPEVYMDPQIFAAPVTGLAPLTVYFYFTVFDADSWIWHFEEGATDTARATSYTFENYGYHEVTLEANSGPPHYCIETDTILIFVDVVISIEANSVFTPNDDGFNDFFEIHSEGLAELNVDIFSQWGNKVYEINEIEGKWDGNTSGGAKAPDGTYFYNIEARGINNMIYERQGSVLLLRHAAKASPVPARDQVKVTIYDELVPPVNITVYNVFGQIVHNVTLNNSGDLIINISHLDNGIYILKIEDGYKDYFVRIVKS